MAYIKSSSFIGASTYIKKDINTKCYWNFIHVFHLTQFKTIFLLAHLLQMYKGPLWPGMTAYDRTLSMG